MYGTAADINEAKQIMLITETKQPGVGLVNSAPRLKEAVCVARTCEGSGDVPRGLRELRFDGEDEGHKSIKVFK